MINKYSFFLFFVLSFLSSSLFGQQSTELPKKREVRGIWIATVTNIDWPSRPGLSPAQQRQELIAILDQHQQTGINTVMLQVRPTADAFYAKSRELWSHWLMGKQGLSPMPEYDPLEFAIKECHARGMELHAWFNPYRATMSAKAVTDASHISKTKPEWFYTYAGQKLFDPGIPEVREYIMQVILDVVKGYDIDGVHFDDYFYPYPVSGQKISDQATFVKYPNGFNNINDWRRNNVDLLIKMVNDSVHHYKKHVKFGVSPFGIWKNYRQDTLGTKSNGLSNYHELFADSRKWIKEGWVDYINPQIYFTFSRAQAPFSVLTDWWSNNTFGRHLYIGQAAYLIRNPALKGELAWTKLNEIPNQIRYIRANNRVQGSIFFSSKSMSTVAKSLTDSLRSNFYQYPALPPQMPWLDEVEPNEPQQLTAEIKNGSVYLHWNKPLISSDGETASGYVIYRFEEGEEINIDNPKSIVKILFKEEEFFTDNFVNRNKHYTYVVTALDRLKNESEGTSKVTVQIK